MYFEGPVTYAMISGVWASRQDLHDNYSLTTPENNQNSRRKYYCLTTCECGPLRMRQ